MEQQSVFALLLANFVALSISTYIEKDVVTFPAWTDSVNRREQGALWSEWSETLDQSKKSVERETEWEGQEDDDIAKCECDLQLTQVNNKLRRMVTQLNSTINSLDTKYFILKENYLDLKEDNKILKENISKLQDQNNDLMSENCKINQTLKDLQLLKNNMLEENNRLKFQIDKLNLTIIKINKTMEEVNEENAQLWNFTTKVSKQIITSSHADRNETISDTSDMQWNLAELQNLQEDVWQYKNKCEAYSKENNEETENANSELAALKKKLEFHIELNQKKCNQTIQNLDMVKLENRYYYVSSQGFALRWHEARDFCTENHLSLLQIETSEENNRIIAHTHGTHGVYFWTGGTQIDQEGRFEWAGSNTSVTPKEFSDWVEGHPARSGNPQHCLALWTYGETVKWTGYGCENALRFICEMQESCDFSQSDKDIIH